MTPGYKMTELGEIPEEWNIVSWGEISEICYGKDQKEVQDINGKYAIYGTGGIMSYATKFLYDGESVLIGRKGTIDKPFYLNIPFWTVDTLFYTKIKDIAIPKWFYYNVLNTPLKKYNEATGVPSLNRNSLNTIKALLPPLKEQQKIADILSTVDEKIEVIEAKIVQTQELKKGLMQQLLTRGIGHTKFKTSELGEIPESWEVVALEQLIKVKHGFAFQGISFSKEKNKKILLSPVNFKLEGGFKIDWNRQKFYSGNCPDEYVLKKGDLIIALTDLTQSCDILGSPAVIPDSNYQYLHNQRLGLVSILHNNKLSNEYLYHFLNSIHYRSYLKSTKTGSTVSHTSPKTIYSVKIALPLKSEQEQIANILNTVDDKLQILHAKKENFTTLKKGLMQQLLTGKLRVTC